MYIPKVLKITDWKRRLTQDRIALLTDLIRASVVNIPFQNITCIGSLERSQRRPPSFEDALWSGLTGTGGLCGHNNTFIQYTLKSLGYEAYLAAGNFRRTGIPGSHVLCQVRIPYLKSNGKVLNEGNNKNDNWFLVDVGSSMPIHEPIQISKLPYYGRAGGLNYRYEQLPNGIVQRVNESGDPLVGPKPKEYLSPQDYTIDMTPIKRFSAFEKPISQYFNKPEMFLHNALFCFRYLELSDNDFKVVWIRGTEIVIATKETRTSTVFKGYYEMAPFVHQYFPMINSTDIDIAIETFSTCLAEAENRAASSA